MKPFDFMVLDISAQLQLLALPSGAFEVVGKPLAALAAIAFIGRHAVHDVVGERRVGEKSCSDPREVHIIVSDQKADLFLCPKRSGRDDRYAFNSLLHTAAAVSHRAANKAFRYRVNGEFHTKGDV